MARVRRRARAAGVTLISEFVASRRYGVGLKQHDLAQLLSMPPPNVALLEMGQRWLPREHLPLFADVLQVEREVLEALQARDVSRMWAALFLNGKRHKRDLTPEVVCALAVEARAQERAAIDALKARGTSEAYASLTLVLPILEAQEALDHIVSTLALVLERQRAAKRALEVLRDREHSVHDRVRDVLDALAFDTQPHRAILDTLEAHTAANIERWRELLKLNGMEGA